MIEFKRPETRADITPSVVKELLNYDLKTGLLYWRKRDRKWFKRDQAHGMWNKRYAGKHALCTLDKYGYRSGALFGIPYRAHRVVWAHQTGAWPEGEIDHINGVTSDNRISNLRDVSHLENSRNRARRPQKYDGVTGVRWVPRERGWRAYIGVKGEMLYLGIYDDRDDAIAARKAAEVKYGFHPNHGRPAAQEQGDG